MKKQERTEKENKYVAERFAELDTVLLNHDEAQAEEYEAVAEVGRVITCTCTHVLAEYFTAKVEEMEAAKASPPDATIN